MYIDAFLSAKKALSRDGMIAPKGAETALRALVSADAKLAEARSRGGGKAAGGTAAAP